MVSETNSLLSGLTDLMETMDGLGGGNSAKDPPRPVVPKKVEPGIICQVDGLNSDAGKGLNGRRCAIVRFVEGECRYEVRMEKETGGHDKTFALKEANLKILPRLALPSHRERGSDSTAKSLCELLLYYKGSGPYTKAEFEPSRIVLKGYAATCLNRIANSNLQWLVPCQLEQIAGVLGLASVCQDYEEGGAEDVLFAFLVSFSIL